LSDLGRLSFGVRSFIVGAAQRTNAVLRFPDPRTEDTSRKNAAAPAVATNSVNVRIVRNLSIGEAKYVQRLSLLILLRHGGCCVLGLALVLSQQKGKDPSKKDLARVQAKMSLNLRLLERKCRLGDDAKLATNY